MSFIGATGIFFGWYRLVLGVAMCCKHRSCDTGQTDRSAPPLAPAVWASTSQVAGG